jgi:hypothetical protein
MPLPINHDMVLPRRCAHISCFALLVYYGLRRFLYLRDNAS